MSALEWVRARATSKPVYEIEILVGDDETPAGIYQVQDFYFRGYIPANMKRSLIKDAKHLIKEVFVYENIRMAGNSACEYSKSVYTLIK